MILYRISTRISLGVLGRRQRYIDDPPVSTRRGDFSFIYLLTFFLSPSRVSVRAKGESMEQLVGWSTLKDDFVTWVNRLVDGPIVILRQNKAVGVMVSFEDYREMKARAEVVVLPSTSESKALAELIAEKVRNSGSEPTDG